LSITAENHSTPSISELLVRLWRHNSRRRRLQFCGLLFLMILASFAEIFSIGVVLPFLGVLTAPARVFALPEMQGVVQFFGVTTPEGLLLPLTILFGAASFSAGALRLLLLWASTRLSFAAGADLSMSIYRRTLYQPYAVQVGRNSSEVIDAMSTKTLRAIDIMLSVFNFISALVMLAAILVALVVIDPYIAFLAFAGFGLIYGVIVHFSRKRLLRNSKRIAHESTQLIKSIHEGLGGIRDVLLDGTQDVFCQVYQSADLPLRRAQGNNFFISQSPRYAMEALGMMLIASLAYILAGQPDGIGKAIPVLGALALGAQRLLPVLQQAYAAWSNVQGGQASLNDTIRLLDQSLPDFDRMLAPAAIPFNYELVLRDVGFRYQANTPWVLENLDLTISKGARMGFIGSTGSGKSTLLDLVMGLLEPTNGHLSVDGLTLDFYNRRAWQSHIAHVPQSIFLSDSSIAENIAFGVPKSKIDMTRVQRAAKQAHIDDAIQSWPLGYSTLVGERGVRLSGGQRQRIGIARALYKQADVIVFDEATSALDNDTEEAVMQAIDELSHSGELTILIIAHRLSTLRNCTQVVELQNGKVARMGSYSAIVGVPS